VHLLLESFASQFGVSAAWGRIFYLYGPHENVRRFVPYVITSILNHQSARCTDGSQIRDYLHVEDVASALVALLCSDVQGPVNIGSGIPVSLRQIAEYIAETTGRPDLLQLGVLSSSTNDPPLLVADNRRLLQQVGWTPRYSIETGLEQTIDWWQSQLTIVP
jgi:nucleoside-diphosphate-sugar epimerase